MVLSYVLGTFVLVFVLLGQTRVRPVPRVFRPRLPVFVGVIGFFDMVAYAGSHHVSSTAWAWTLGSMLVAAGLGALRGLSVRVWKTDAWVLRQGTGITMVLWAVSLVAPFVGGAAGTSGLESSSFLLYLGLTLGLQAYVLYRRASPMWAELGPDAGRPLQVVFSRDPGAFFAAFRDGGMGPTAPAQWDTRLPRDDPDIIDVEVVEDDDDHGPPELRSPG